MSTFEAAKLGAVPVHFTDLEAAVNYIAGSRLAITKSDPGSGTSIPTSSSSSAGEFSRRNDGRDDPYCLVQSHPLDQEFCANGLIGWTFLRSLTRSSIWHRPQSATRDSSPRTTFDSIACSPASP